MKLKQVLVLIRWWLATRRPSGDQEKDKRGKSSPVEEYHEPMQNHSALIPLTKQDDIVPS
jgi:hypothetical protein